MNKPLRYFLSGNFYAVAGIVFAMLLTPGGGDLSIGLSYYSTHLPGVLPFTGGLLALAAYLFLALRVLPPDLPTSVRWGWGLMVVCAVGLALTPFGFNVWSARGHIFFGFALFIVKLLIVIGLAAHERTRRTWLLALMAATSLVTLAVYWAAVVDTLLIGQLIFQGLFIIIIADALWRYGDRPKAMVKRPGSHLAAAQKGFTIIELMIATTVFSLVLLLCSYGLVQIGRTYNKGITTARTQEAARSIIDEISRAIQFSGGTIATTPAQPADGVPYVFCIDEQRYSVVTDRQLKDAPADNSQLRNVLVADTFGGCNASTPPRPLTNNQPLDEPERNPRELLPVNMRVARLDVTYLEDNLYRITVRIVAGENDLLDAAHDNCQNVRAGTQFCAVSELSTVVQKRL